MSRIRSFRLMTMIAIGSACACAAAEREVLVSVMNWNSPIGGIVDGSQRWGLSNYAYLRQTNGSIDMNYPLSSGVSLPDEVVYASDEFYRLQREGAKHDLSLMKAGGFDAVMYDGSPTAQFDSTHPLSPSNQPFIGYLVFREWLIAATASGMKVGFSPDIGWKTTAASWIERLSFILNDSGSHPSQYRIDGKTVIMHFGTSYSMKAPPVPGDPKPDEGWRKVTGALREKGHSFYFAADIRPSDANIADWHLTADAVYLFAPAGPRTYFPDVHPLMASRMSNTLPIIWSVSPGYYNPRLRSYTEPDFERIHLTYLAAMSNNAERLIVLTWNDFAEDTDIVPSANKGSSLYDVFTFYNKWFKSGVMPKPLRDRVIIAMPKTIPRAVKSKASKWGGGNLFWPNSDYAPKVFYWAVVAKPRRLSVGGKTVDLPAGLSFGECGSVQAGAQHAELDGKTISLPPVGDADTEGTEEKGLFLGYGLHFRYFDLAAR